MKNPKLKVIAAGEEGNKVKMHRTLKRGVFDDNFLAIIQAYRE